MAKRRAAGRDALTAWHEENPLRMWRLRQPPEGWSRSLLARQLKVSHTAVGSWETGKRLPMVDAVAKIEKLTGITATQWMEWYDCRPQIS
jgi:ribosome-binding protein aMBF1 (putative translation factor)